MVLGAVLFFLAVSVTALFPRECFPTNASNSCCPPPANEALPCGGPGIGECLPYLSQGLYAVNASWFPFDNVCVCHGNYWGARCDLCRPGFTGLFCTQPAEPRIRREWSTLSNQEKKDVIFAINAMKHAGTFLAYSVSEITPLSDYDAFVWMHLRSVYNPDPSCNVDCSYAHNGPAFATWHRQFLLLFETIFLKYLPLRSTVTALPYLNWTLPDAFANVMTSEYFGGDGDPTANYQLQDGAFANWQVIGLDGSRSSSGIRRDFDQRALTEIPTWETIVQMVHQKDSYDSWPWTIPCSNNSFVNNLEGYLGNAAVGSCKFHRFMHNLIHLVIGGQHGDMGDVPVAARDPLFFLHHTFIDAIFELWQTVHPQITDFMPRVGGPPGHNAIDCIAPVFPCAANEDMLTPSANLGFQYDFLIPPAAPAPPAPEASSSNGYLIATFSLMSVIIVVSLIAVGIYARKKCSMHNYNPM